MGESSAGYLAVFCLWSLFFNFTLAGKVQILRGQCYAYCLTRYTNKSVHESKDADPIKTCKKDEDCKWCFYVCDRRDVKHYTNKEHCKLACQYCYEEWCFGDTREITVSCDKACGFVNRAAKLKSGSCPDSVTLRDFETACVSECDTDDDCYKNKKCCQNDCGLTCQKPLPDERLPAKPVNIEFQDEKDESVLMTWSRGMNDERREQIKPEIYLIQYWPKSSSRRPRRRYRITTSLSYKVFKLYNDIAPGKNFHFKLAAINIHGSNGFTEVYSYSKPVKKPSRPRNLQVLNEKARFGNNTVDLTISWQPPSYTYGLRIQKYLIYWLKLPNPSTSYLRQDYTRKSVPSNKHRYELSGLEAGSNYMVQVRAVAIFNDNQYKSRPASLQIETDSPPSSPVEGDSWSYLHGNNDIYNITVLDSYYHQGNLKSVVTWQSAVSSVKYMLFWKEENCKESSKSSHSLENSATSHRLEFELYNLQFGCNYVVRIHPVDDRSRMRSPAVTSFTTPHCSVVLVKGRRAPECPIGDKLPGQPKNVTIEFLGDLCSKLTVVVEWQPEPWQEGRKYVVLWGTSTQSTLSQVIYTSQPHKSISSGNVHKVILSQIQMSTHYTVQVSIQTSYGEGRPVIKHFTTPTLICPTTSTTTTTTQQVFYDSTTNSANLPTSALTDTTTVKQRNVHTSKSNGANTVHINCLSSLLLLLLLYQII